MLIVLAALASGCVAVEGERILARDLAGALPAFAALPPDRPLGFAPAPGARRILSARDLARYGVSSPPVCIERVMEYLTPERILAALRAAVQRGDARIELLEFSRAPVPPGELEFVRPAAAGALWRGRVRYAGNRSYPVWARAKVLVKEVRVVAAENLGPGRAIEPAQVRAEEGEYTPAAGTLTSLEQAVGRVPRFVVRRGTPLTAAMLGDPPAVARGDTVTVEVSSGAAQVKLQARAEAAGAPGDVITVTNPANGRRFAARIEEKGKVKVDAKLDLSTGARGTRR